MNERLHGGTIRQTIWQRHNSCHWHINRLQFRGNHSATSNNMKLVHWPLMGGLLHLVQRVGDWRGLSPPRPLLAVPNVTASVPITVLLYNGPLLWGFNVAVKGINSLCVKLHLVKMCEVTCRQNIKQYLVRHDRNDVNEETKTSNDARLTAYI